MGPHALADRLEGRPAVSLLGHMPSHDVADTVIDCHEQPAPAVRLRVEPGRIGAPQFVGRIGRDPAAVAPVSSRVPAAHRRQQPVLPHQPQHAVLAHSDPFRPQAGSHLPVPLTQEVALPEHLADLLDQGLIAQLRLRPPLPGLPNLRAQPSSPHPVYRRTRHPPHLADHRQRVASSRPQTHSLPRLKSFLSSCPNPLFSRSSAASSIRIVISPNFARVRISSRSAPSPLRLFSPCWPLSKNTRRYSSRSTGET